MTARLALACMCGPRRRSCCVACRSRSGRDKVSRHAPHVAVRWRDHEASGALNVQSDAVPGAVQARPNNCPSSGLAKPNNRATQDLPELRPPAPLGGSGEHRTSLAAMLQSPLLQIDSSLRVPPRSTQSTARSRIHGGLVAIKPAELERCATPSRFCPTQSGAFLSGAAKALLTAADTLYAPEAILRTANSVGRHATCEPRCALRTARAAASSLVLSTATPSAPNQRGLHSESAPAWLV